MMTVKRITPWLYWLIPIVSIVMQFVMTRSGTGHIRLEEISESIRGPYWFVHGRIFQGLSSHIGWYAQLVLWYQLFGFTLRGAADFRFFLHIISIICLASLLKKYLGVKIAWIPLAAIGFSPTLLYFNSLATHFGIDLQYLPIVLFLLDRIQFTFYKDHTVIHLIPHAVLWTFVMTAWMSYPTMAYYLPALAIVYAYKMQRTYRLYLLICIVFFLLPLILGFAFIQNRTLLIYDANDHSGIFRGAAHTLDMAHGWDRVRESFVGFATVSPSYYYEVEHVEFSNWFPLLALSAVLLITIYLWIHQKKYRLWIVPVLVIVFLNIITLWLFSDTGGIGYASTRRATGILASFYMFFVIACHWFMNKGIHRKYWLVCFFLFLFIPIHHLAVFLPNVKVMTGPSRYDESTWFKTKRTIIESLASYQETLEKDDIQVACPYAPGIPTDCSYVRLYAAVSASCYWNHHICHQIWGWDPFHDTYVRLRIPLWDKEWRWEKYDFISSP
jgi:hypothetical protein